MKKNKWALSKRSVITNLVIVLLGAVLCIVNEVLRTRTSLDTVLPHTSTLAGGLTVVFIIGTVGWYLMSRLVFEMFDDLASDDPKKRTAAFAFMGAVKEYNADSRRDREGGLAIGTPSITLEFGKYGGEKLNEKNVEMKEQEKEKK